jgi:hypothetical protein
LTDSFWDRRWFAKPVQECGAARKILRLARFKISKFGPRQDDPPDCEGFLNEKWSAVEVTRLTHENTRKRAMKAIEEGKHPDHYRWERNEVVRAIQERITKKDKGVARYKGRPYQRYVLVIHTAEFVLDSSTMRKSLKGATFQCGALTDVVLGLSYEPASKRCHTFRLRLARA